MQKGIIFKLRWMFFSISIFCYYAQFFFNVLSSFIVPALGICLLLSINDISKNINNNILFLLSIYYLFIGCSLIISVFHSYETTKIVRFLLILIILPLFFININTHIKHDFFNMFIFFSCLKAIILIVIYIIFLKSGSYKLLREFALIHGGDIYSLGGLGGRHLYIQIQGNALLLVSFMLRFFRTKIFDLINLILFLGVFLAGNFAFYLGITVFFGYCIYKRIIDNKREWYITIVLAFCLFIIGSFIFLPYVQEQIRFKAIKSNVVRVEQAKILLSGNIITGNGIGNRINAQTSTRIYDGDLYFELQTLYIINQIGFVGYILFMFCTLYIFYIKNKNMMIVYLIYIFYSFWNPYCFDTTHMIAALLLINEQYPTNKEKINNFL